MSSGLADWLPALPEAWQLKPFYSLFSERIQPNTGLQVEIVLSLSYGRIIERDVESNHGLLPASFEGYNIVEPNDIVLRLTDLQNDQRSLRSGQVTERGVITSAYVTVVPNDLLHPRFAHYLLHGYDLAKLFYRMGGGLRQSLKFDDLKRMPLVQPPLPQQERIANFLDEQTARIDALIAEKEQLLLRLGELRYSTVSWAVTGGLHSGKGKIKTGHSFVSELPVGWQLGGLTKYIGPVVDYRGKTPEKVDEGVLLVTARNIRDGFLDYSASSEYVREDAYDEIMRRGRPEMGDVLFTTEAPLGQVANVDRVDIALAQRVVKFRGLKGVLNNYFLKYWLMGDVAQSTLTTLATGSTAEGIKASKLGQIPVAVPSVTEQAEIVAYLEERRRAIDSVSSHAKEHISRLREYRSSLISAAVTGQLAI